MGRLKSKLKSSSAYFLSRYYSPQVKVRSPLRNVYQVNMVRTASTWLAGLLADPRVYVCSGLTVYNYQAYCPGHADPRPSTYRPFGRPMPARCIATLYNDRDSFAETPKPGQWRAVAVVRDPRDLLTSWYFAFKYSHKLQGDTPRLRNALAPLDDEEGLLFGIRHLEEVGIFRALRSWSVGGLFGGRVLSVPYERLTGPEQETTMKMLIQHLMIPLEGDELRQLLEDHSFRRKTGGRDRGAEDVRAHYRKGTPGDWRNHFTPAVLDAFRKTTSDLVAVMGYAWDGPACPPVRGGVCEKIEKEGE